MVSKVFCGAMHKENKEIQVVLGVWEYMYLHAEFHYDRGTTGSYLHGRRDVTRCLAAVTAR
jgi:hypothetical protein